MNISNPAEFSWRKNRSARSKNHRWHQGNGENPLGSPGSASSHPLDRRNPPPPIRRTPRLSSQEIRRAEEIGESRLYRENDRKSSVDPRRRSWLNISKHAESSTDILNEFHRPWHNDTNCQRPRNGRDFDKNESTIVKMNASCTICATMKRRCIKLVKISMDNSPSYSLKSSVIMADFRNPIMLRYILVSRQFVNSHQFVNGQIEVICSVSYSFWHWKLLILKIKTQIITISCEQVTKNQELDRFLRTYPKRAQNG